MDSYNPFTSSQDPFEEDLNKNTEETGKNDFSFSFLRPIAFYLFLIVLGIGTISIFMRPPQDILVVVESKDENTNDQQEIVNQTTVPSTTSTTTTTSTTGSPKTITESDIINARSALKPSR